MSTSSEKPVSPKARGAGVVARGLVRQFGDHVALDSLTLTIEPGERLGLLGANGAGKTTLIRMMTGYLVPSAGEILIDGLSPATDPRAVQERIGFVSETSHLYPDLKVEPFLRFAGGIRGLAGGALRDAVTGAIDRFNLTAVRRRRIGNLSKGFQQRVSLAQAFLHQPKLLIADEPTSGLDPVQRAEVQASLATLAEGRTLVLCTHDLAEARALTTRVAVLSHGNLTALGPTDEVLSDHQSLELFRKANAAPPEPQATT